MRSLWPRACSLVTASRVVWLEGHAAPVSRHDTQAEAEFRAAAYRRALRRGHELAFSPPCWAGALGRW